MIEEKVDLLSEYSKIRDEMADSHVGARFNYCKKQMIKMKNPTLGFDRESDHYRAGFNKAVELIEPRFNNILSMLRGFTGQTAKLIEENYTLVSDKGNFALINKNKELTSQLAESRRLLDLVAKTIETLANASEFYFQRTADIDQGDKADVYAMISDVCLKTLEQIKKSKSQKGEYEL